MSNNTVLVDLLGFTGHRGGTETYAQEICSRLPEAMSSWDFVALTNRVGSDTVRSFFPGEVLVTSWPFGGNAKVWALAELTAVDRVARQVKASVVWSPANFGSLHPSAPTVVTLHDMIYRLVPGNGLQRPIRRLTAALMEGAARAATEVITVSETTQADIVARLGISVEHVKVIHNGTVAPKAQGDPWDILAPLVEPTERTIMLSIGNRLPHKNFESLLRSLALIPDGRRPLTIITGGGRNDPLAPLVANLGLSNDVILLGWVSSEQLEALYAVATVYACPSLNEGFGLPIIDAMRRGCCVVANDIPVLHEVGGTAALYADAQSAPSFASTVQSLLDDRVALEERRVASIARGERFTWESAATATAQVLCQAAKRHCP